MILVGVGLTEIYVRVWLRYGSVSSPFTGLLDMLFRKLEKSGLVALNLDIAQVKEFVKERLGVEVV
jgi:hypothetical protein